MISKFNKFLSNNILKIFIAFILSQPIFDMLIGLFFKNNIVDYMVYFIKVLFLFVMIYYMFFIKKKSKLYIIFLILYVIIYILVNGVFENGVNILFEVSQVLKSIYFPISLIFCLELFKDKEIDNKYIIASFMIYLFAVFIPNILHIGHNSYEVTKKGSIGFYISANLIGNIFSILFPLVILYFIKKKQYILLGIISVIYLYTLLTMGTKGPLICILIMVIYYTIYIFIKLIKSKKYLIVLILFLLIIVAVVLSFKIIPKTSFYKNLLIHLEYLNIQSFTDLLTFKNIDHFVFGSRFAMLGSSFNEFIKSSIFNILFGIGYMINYIVVKTSEMDYFVVFIHQGIIGFILILSLYFKNIAIIIKNYFKRFKSNFLDFEKSTLFISLLISILCAFFIGHELDTPSVAIFVSLIITITYKKII